MPITVKHNFVSAIPDSGDVTIVQPSNWNADHTLIGLGTMAEQDANSVAITGGTISGVTLPASNITGTLGVPNGGTGSTTLTGYVKGTGTSPFSASSTIPNTDITGLGTMSTQNANSVAITGGTITGIAITASPAGLNTEIQYNNAGSLGANANFTYTGGDVNIPFGTSNSATSTAKIALALSMIA